MKKETAGKQFGRNACDAVGFGGTMGCAFVNGNVSAWESSPFLSQALRSEKAECRRPNMDPWTVQGVKSV